MSKPDRTSSGESHVSEAADRTFSGESPPEGSRRACELRDLPETGALRVEFDDVDVAIVRSDGQLYAIEDVCSHAEVALSEGEVEGCTIECWMHGSRFDLRSGAPTGPPATEPVDVFEVQVSDGVVYVSTTTRQTNGRQNLSAGTREATPPSWPDKTAVLKQKEQATS